MKRLFAVCLLVWGAIVPAAADGQHLGAGWIYLPEVVVRSYALGFTELTEIEAEDGVWKAKGFRRGVYTTIALDPLTGDAVAPAIRRRHSGPRR